MRTVLFKSFMDATFLSGSGSASRGLYARLVPATPSALATINDSLRQQSLPTIRAVRCNALSHPTRQRGAVVVPSGPYLPTLSSIARVFDLRCWLHPITHDHSLCVSGSGSKSKEGCAITSTKESI